MTSSPPTYCARCLLPVWFAPGRTHTICLACGAALRLATEPRHPGTAIADDDLVAYPPEARAADRCAALTAALAALEDAWRAGRWGRIVGLLGRRYRDIERPGTRFGCFIPDLLLAGLIVVASLGIVVFTIVGAARHDAKWADVKVGLWALAFLILFGYFVRETFREQLGAVAAFRLERSTFLARRAALRAALGQPPRSRGAPRLSDDDGPRLV